MKVLTVRNSIGPQGLLEKVFSQENEVTTIVWNGFADISVNDFDIAVLSGSSNFPIVGNEEVLTQELDFIRQGTIPILGICYGHELITTAFGGTLKHLSHKERGVLHVTIAEEDPLFDGIKDLFVYEGHQWAIDTLPKELKALAISEHGIEAVRHIDRPIYGLQFHPEKLQHETAGHEILSNFLRIYSR